MLAAESQREMAARDRLACPFCPTPEAFSDDELFQLVQEWDACNFVMAAQIDDEAHAKGARSDGLYPNLPYTLLAAAQVGTVRLLRLRNPWGAEEWTGKWGDCSELWAAHPAVAEAAGFRGPEQDGTFWMCLEDFAARFASVYCCPARLATQRSAHTSVKRKPAPVGLLGQLQYGLGAVHRGASAAGRGAAALGEHLGCDTQLRGAGMLCDAVAVGGGKKRRPHALCSCAPQ